MRRISYRTLVRICSINSVWWVLAAFAIMRCFILPTAHRELDTQSGICVKLDELILWHPEDVCRVLSDYSARTKALYSATELTAGIVDALLTLIVSCVLLGYFLFRLRISKCWTKLFLLPVAGVVADLCVTSGLVYLLQTYPSQSESSITWIRGFCVLRLLAYTGLIIGLGFVLVRHLLVPASRKRDVNSS